MITRMNCCDPLPISQRKNNFASGNLFQEIAEKIGLRFMEDRKPFFMTTVPEKNLPENAHSGIPSLS
jgi:hypothetical protein